MALRLLPSAALASLALLRRGAAQLLLPELSALQLGPDGLPFVPSASEAALAAAASQPTGPVEAAGDAAAPRPEASSAASARAEVAEAEELSEEQEHVVGPHEVCAGGGEQYSGLLPAGGGARYFFWLAHSRSAAPADDPLVIWLTGGPGCSSSLALLTENGPCHVVGSAGQDGSGQTRRNPWSWTEAANVVWVDQPAGVGFSEGPTVVTTENGVDDHMYAFLLSFYRRFPELQRVPLFLVGESYAGHYLPAVAARILKEPHFAGSPIPLKGVGIGNGLVNPWPQLASQPPMAYTGGVGGSLGHGVVSLPAYRAMETVLEVCPGRVLECQRAKEPLTCWNTFQRCVTPQLYPVMKTDRNLYDMRFNCTAGYPMCYSFARETEFLSSPEVQRALGVQRLRKWESCNHDIVLSFVLSCDWMQRFDDRVAELLGAGVRVLVYNGDTDYMVDWVGSKRWLEELNWPHRVAWAATRDAPFLVNGTAAGVERSHAGLTFVQMYNAGHLVPMNQPRASLAMLRELLDPDSRWAVGGLAAAVPAPAQAEVLEPAALERTFAAALASAAALLALFARWFRNAWKGVAAGDRYVSLEA